MHISRRLLDVSAALVREGIPLADVLTAARGVRDHAEALATLFTTLVLTENRTTDDLTRLRPWRRAWWRRNCRWRWTAGSAAARGLERPPRRAARLHSGRRTVRPRHPT